MQAILDLKGLRSENEVLTEVIPFFSSALLLLFTSNGNLKRLLIEKVDLLIGW